jgi:SAM-dependent methyltransferase
MHRSAVRQFFRAGLRAIEHSDAGLRVSLRYYRGARGPHGSPSASWENSALKTSADLARCLDQVRRLGLPPMRDAAKNWDSLCALDLILRSTAANARILDAGAARWSMILPWLFLYGYRDLTAVNVEFSAPFRRGPIRYLTADITAMDFPDANFDAVTCLSVIEHGVDPESFFAEMSRIVVPGGLLIVSTDYFEPPVSTEGMRAYGAPVRIFDRQDIDTIVSIAGRHGWSITTPLDLSCDEKVVHWEEFGLRFTFLVLAMRKAAQ